MPLPILNSRIGRALLCLALSLAHGASNAQALHEMFVLARGHDPQVRSARSEHDAAIARLDQARATFLPQINLTANTTYTDQTLSYDSPVQPDRSNSFGTNGYNLQITQPLIRLANHAQKAGASAQVDQTEAQVAVSEMDLLNRLSQAYFEACQFDEAVKAAQSDVAQAASESQDLAARNHRGDAPEFEHTMALARLSQAEAQNTEAAIERDQRLLVLRQLTGLHAVVSDLQCTSSMVPPSLGTVDQWVNDALFSSPQVKARAMAVRVANAQLSGADAGHWPTLDLVATKALNEQGPSASLDLGTRSRSNALALQLNVPLYSGGGLSAKQRESAALLAKAEAELDAAQVQLRSEVSQAFGSLRAGLAHVQAIELSVQAQVQQLQAVRRRLAHGVAIATDVLSAERDLARARSEAARFHGVAMSAYVRLLAMKGEVP